jgi:hypothetical protein
MSKKDYPYRIQPVEYAMLNYSDKFKKTRDAVIDFMERNVFGAE